MVDVCSGTILSLVLAIQLFSLVEGKTTYVVGGWQPQTPGQPPQTPATIAKTLAPVFQDYLTETVGKKLTPPAKFVFKGVDIDSATASRDLILSGQLDFLYTLSGGVACKAAEFSWTPLATQKNIVGSTVFGSDALVMFSLKNNTSIRTVQDLKGKKLGCGYLWSGPTYLQGYQVRFYGPDYESYYQAVLRGDLDAGFVASSWLIKNHPKEMDQLLVHERKDGLMYEGEVYPYAVSKLTPTYGVIASDSVSWQLKRMVLEALQALNASHPGMKLMKIAGWLRPMNYGVAFTSMVNSGVIYEDEEGKKRCRDPYSRYDIWQSITCPKGDNKVDYDTSLRQCNQSGIACPAGAHCFCQPCQAKPLNIFPWETVVGLCAALYGVGVVYLILPRLPGCGPLADSGASRGKGQGRNGFPGDPAAEDSDGHEEGPGAWGGAGRRRLPSPGPGRRGSVESLGFP